MTRTEGALAVEAAGWQVGGTRVVPMAELTGDDRSAPAWAVAARASAWDERVTLGLAWGRSIEPARRTRASLSLKLAF